MIFKRRSTSDRAVRRDEPKAWPAKVDLHRFVATKFIEPGVLHFGVVKGFLTASDVVSLELMRYVSGELAEGSAEETIALLLSDEFERVPPLLETARADDTRLSSDQPLDIWAYVGLARINSMWDSFDDPWDAVEWHLQLLEYPEAYKHFLRYTRAERGEPTGLNHMKNRLDAFVDRCQSQWGQ